MVILPDPSVVFEYARPGLEAELERADWRVQLVAAVLGNVARSYNYGVRFTSVERTFDQTRELYRQAGKRLPANPGVHDVRPCRAADAVPFPLPAHIGAPRVEVSDWEQWHRIARNIARETNARLAYGRGFEAALWHRVGGEPDEAYAGFHWHMQVPYYALRCRPPRSDDGF